jgi:predicted nucleotidyltransferase
LGDEKSPYKISRMSAVATKQEILRRIQTHREEIRALGVEGLGLFGSFVRGEQGPESDVDLLVRFRPREKTFDNFMGLAFLLEDVLQRRVELVTTEGLSPYLGPQILEEVQDMIFSSS